jgi:predicted transcriptional regulator
MVGPGSSTRRPGPAATSPPFRALHDLPAAAAITLDGPTVDRLEVFSKVLRGHEPLIAVVLDGISVALK